MKKSLTVPAAIIFLGIVGFLLFYQISNTNCTSISESDVLPEGALPGIPDYSIEVHEVNRTESISGDSGAIYPQDGTDFILVDATLHAHENPLSIDVEDIELKELNNEEDDMKCGVYDLSDREPTELGEGIASGVIEVESDSTERAMFVFEVPDEFMPETIGTGPVANFTLEPW